MTAFCARPARRLPAAFRAALLVPLGAALVAACASEPRPWKVRPGDERRFGQAERACRQLTDDAPGFERCMERRGFRREYPFGL